MSKPNRIERIKQIEEILLANNKGWTRSELAKRFSVDRSTLKRDMRFLRISGPMNTSKMPGGFGLTGRK